MASNNSNTANPIMRSILDKEKLTGNNFPDWHRNLRIVLRQERKLYVLEGPVPEEPAPTASRAIKDAWQKHSNDAIDVSCLMLGAMIPSLQKDLELLSAYNIISILKEMFQKKARHERCDVMKTLMFSRMQEGADVGDYVLSIKSHIEHLDRLGFPISQELAVDIILNSLPKCYDQFVLNFNMNGMEKTISEIHGMLKTAEKNVDSKPTPQVLMVRNDGINKKKKKASSGKSKAKPKSKPDSKAKTKNKTVCF